MTIGYKQLPKIDAAIQVTMSMSVGVGRGASAIIGDRIVTERAVTLNMPNTVPRTYVGKNSRVAT